MAFSLPSTLFLLTLAAGDSVSADSIQAAVAQRLDNRPLVRVTTRSGQRLGHAVSTPAGLDFSSTSFRGMEKPGAPTLVAWSDIERVEVGRTRMGSYAAIGAAVGMMASVLWIAADEPESDAGFLKFGATDSGKAFGRMLLGTAFGAALGAGIGYSQKTWQSIHP
jgi:hypothetical protein